MTASDAVQSLGHGERVHVVLDQDRQPELAAQGRPERDLVPAEWGESTMPLPWRSTVPGTPTPMPRTGCHRRPR